jgi:hypothetical protein
MEATPVTRAGVLVAAALLVSCGGTAKKADDAKAEKKTDGASDKSGDDAKGEQKSANEGTASTAAEGPVNPGFDCGAVVTSEDIQKACGVQTQGEISKAEGRSPLAACSRKFRGAENKSISFQFAIHPSLEKVSSIAWPEDATGVPDLGDAASAYVADKGNKFDWHTVEVRASTQIFYLRSINETAGEPLCSTAQLTDLARETFPRTQKP